MNRDVLRNCRFTPYRKGLGLPTFSLTMWDSGRRDWRGQTVMGYSLRQSGQTEPLFTGLDFAGSPFDADDSDATVRSLMMFLTLKPGDTDAEYFEAYTESQRDYCANHAESLAACYWRGKMLTDE